MAKEHLYCNVCGKKTMNLYIDRYTYEDSRQESGSGGGNKFNLWVCDLCNVEREDKWFNEDVKIHLGHPPRRLNS